jgi:hypothetical protein
MWNFAFAFYNFYTNRISKLQQSRFLRFVWSVRKIIEDVMIRISVLWIFLAIANAAHYVMYVCWDPGAIQKMACIHTSEERTKNTRLAIGEAFTSFLIPLTMAFLSVTLGGLANRSLNLVLGGFFTLYGIIHIAKCPIVHISKNPSVHQLLISISIIVVAALIFGYAWSW